MTNKKILVVDNNPVILRLMTSFLEKEGHEVRTASDGLSALYLLENFVPDVIFTDLVMPNIDGEKLCRIVRDMPALAGVYLVVLSGIAAEEEIKYQEFGADACIAKGTEGNIKKHVLDLLQVADQRSGSETNEPATTLGAGEIHTREVTRELLMSKRHFEAIVQHLADGIFELTGDGRVIYANEAAIRLSGIREEKLLATDFKELFPEEARRRLRHALELASSTPQNVDEDPPLLVNQSYVALTLLPVTNNNSLSIVAMMHDITRRVLDAKALNASETRFRELFSHMLAGVAVYESSNGKDFIVVDFNQAAERIDQISRETVIGRNVAEVFPGIEKFGLLEVLHRVWQSGRTEELPLSLYEDGRVMGWRENYVYKLPSGEVVTIYRDITDQKQAEANLAFESETNEAVARLSQMLIAADSIADISIVLLEHAMKLTASTSGFVGYLDEEGSLQTLAITTTPATARKSRPHFFATKKPTGLLGWVMEKRQCVLTNEPAADPRHSAPPVGHLPINRFLAAPAMLGKELIGQVALANSTRNYTERDQAVITQLASLYALAIDKQRNEEQIAHLAHHDPLTGLANRHLLPDRLEQAIRLARRHSTMVALLFMDLDKFKEINDRHGHAVGDEVLREVADRFAQALRASDTIARMGGDEFVVVLQGIKEPGNAATVACKLLALLDRPLAALGGTGMVQGSIGISLYPADGTDGEALLQRADEAMYRAKQNGGRFTFYADRP